MERLSLIILVHNHENVTALCLKSLLLASYRPLQIVLVDNGSNERIGRLFRQFQDRAAKKGIEIEIIKFATNCGTIRTRNIALQRATGRWVALLDNDVIMRDLKVFEKLIAFLERHPNVGIVAPKFVYAMKPFRIQSAGGGVTSDGTCYLLGRGADKDAPEFNETRIVPWVLSACMMMNMDLVRLLGPLDEVFHPVGFEDVDYCFRARAVGKAVVYLSETEVYHVENTTTASITEWNTTKVLQRNKRIFRKKWRSLLPRDHLVEDVGYAYSPQPRVAIWAMNNLPMFG